MPLDPNEAPEGYVAEHSSDGCQGCDFSGDNGCEIDTAHKSRGFACLAYDRNDKTSVIFKKQIPAVGGTIVKAHPDANLHVPGAKDDNDKPMASLLADFGPGLLEVARVATFGAKKYTVRGWMSVPDAEQRYLDAAWRHLLQEGNDTESGLPHIAHAAWNLLAVMSLRGKQ